MHGETVFLVGKNGKTIIDSISFHQLETDFSIGRKSDGGSEIVKFKKTTPLASNNTSIPFGKKSLNPIFSVKGGEFNQIFPLELSSISPDAKIYFTIDGSNPNPNNLGGFVYEYKLDYQYRGSGFIGDSYYRPYRSYLYNNFVDLEQYLNFFFGITDITGSFSPLIIRDKRPPAVTVRAIVIEEGNEPSDIISNTYFFSNNDSIKDQLPIISLTMNENQLKGFYDGIAVPGVDYGDWRYKTEIGTNGISPANYTRRGRDNEIPVNIEVFENYQSKLNQIVGARINGASSRSYAHKSLRLYPRNFYGKDKLTYPFFNNLPYDDYKRLLLRNSGSDFYSTFFKDAVCQQILSGLKMDYQDYNPYNIYINGEYFGLLNAR